MFGFQSLILNLFTWLTLLFPQDYHGNKELPISTHEEVISSGHQQSAAIIEIDWHFNPLLDTSQDTKPPVNRLFGNAHKTSAIAYEPKLLYFSIGNSINVEFTSTKIIFPFHCFT